MVHGVQGDLCVFRRRFAADRVFIVNHEAHEEGQTVIFISSCPSCSSWQTKKSKPPTEAEYTEKLRCERKCRLAPKPVFAQIGEHLARVFGSAVTAVIAGERLGPVAVFLVEVMAQNSTAKA